MSFRTHTQQIAIEISMVLLVAGNGNYRAAYRCAGGAVYVVTIVCRNDKINKKNYNIETKNSTKIETKKIARK